jgi:hypothetical protein
MKSRISNVLPTQMKYRAMGIRLLHATREYRSATVTKRASQPTSVDLDQSRMSSWRRRARHDLLTVSVKLRRDVVAQWCLRTAAINLSAEAATNGSLSLRTIISEVHFG